MVARATATIDVDVLVRATSALRHRGPDDEGYAVVNSASRRVVTGRGADTDSRLDLAPITAQRNGDWSIGLGHRRLSILDLTTAGHQPMPTRDGTCWITFNGEIYNYLELREELAGLGHGFETDSDTEVLIAAYQQWGTGMLPRLVGMFAFAIVDLATSRMLLARDPFGIKPLYYARNDAGLQFASELKALLATPYVSRVVNATELYRYLRFGWTDGTAATFFRDIQQLPAAHFLSLPIDDPTAMAAPVCYWNPADVQPSELSFPDAARTLEGQLRQSLKFHLRSDVPVGACLSGGVDSSVIVQLMRDELGAGGNISTFSFIASDPRVSEEKYVRMMSERARTNSHLITIAPEDLATDFDDLILAQDQPFGSTSIYAQYRVFQAAGAAGMKVMLDGQGSDELFGGYLTAISAQLQSLLAARRLRDAIQLATAGDFIWEGSRARIILSSLGRFVPPGLASHIMPWVGESLQPDWMSSSYFKDRGVVMEPRPQGRGRNALREELMLFTQSLTLPQLLRYEDRSSMRFSIESRVPFCTTALAELAMSVPPEYLVSRKGSTKALLRAAASNLIPREILERPKVGFTTPERDWLSHLRPWIESQLSRDSARTASFLGHDALTALIKAQLEGTGGLFRSSLWRILNVLRWSELVGATFE